jgi:hypothetical protein
MRGAFLLGERLAGIRLSTSHLIEPARRIALGIHPA